MKRVAFIVSLSTVLALVSCNSHKQEKEEVKDYPITNPVTMDTVVAKDYVSQIRSIKNIEVRTQEKGYLDAILVDEGQFISQGQLMFRIRPQLHKAELEKAKAEVTQAQIELQNVETLTNNNVVSKNEKAVAVARLQKAKAEMQLAQIHLNYTEVRAPFSGYVGRLDKRLGSLLDEGELLTTLSDNSNMYAYFNVSEVEYLNYETNPQSKGSDEVDLIMANNKMLPYKGKIETIEGEFNNETGNIAFRAKFANPNKLLRNGETGKVRMSVPLTNALIIPQKATYELQDKKYVFVVGKDGEIHAKQIVINYELPDVYVIDPESISAKDQILLEGIQKIKEGDHIKGVFKEPKKVLKELHLSAN
ncbi:efflux transporter periplasmic adaptor subunit [Myroides marinus]|uniref:Efflux transporter periplasmic adaptor subunit n=1 Tax=Myroides marinus TaxID=703342 RepID=A0A165Q987_9FLAO|nr:efflux RND transporter periplasmic adaptor subunit [Myroides marinus]KZE74102.1 efflux transporter periplasmic adaptor subunit [Myroides marinus]